MNLLRPRARMRDIDRARRLHRVARYLTGLAHALRAFVALEMAFRRARYQGKRQ